MKLLFVFMESLLMYHLGSKSRKHSSSLFCRVERSFVSQVKSSQDVLDIRYLHTLFWLFRVEFQNKNMLHGNSQSRRLQKHLPQRCMTFPCSGIEVVNLHLLAHQVGFFLRRGYCSIVVGSCQLYYEIT